MVVPFNIGTIGTKITADNPTDIEALKPSVARLTFLRSVFCSDMMYWVNCRVSIVKLEKSLVEDILQS